MKFLSSRKFMTAFFLGVMILSITSISAWTSESFSKDTEKQLEKESITNYGILVEEVLFKRLVNGKWIDWNGFTNWNIQVEKEVDVYETQCIQGKEIIDEKNGTSYFEQECSQVKTGTTKQWNPLELNKVYPKENYNVRLIGGKKASVSYDWLIKTNGIILDEWAVWGNISDGDEYLTPLPIVQSPILIQLLLMLLQMLLVEHT